MLSPSAFIANCIGPSGGTLNGRAVVSIDTEEVAEALATLNQAGWRAAVN
jgi:hypothetical protein